MQADVRAWLEAGGSGQYADLFEAQGIEPGHADPTDAHLKEMGVPLGPRSSCSQAIARHPPPRGAANAERRRLTVMFVDLVGSTRVVGRLDPEELRD